MRAVFRLLLNIYDYLVIYLGIAWLGILCLVWTPFAMILYLLLPASWARVLGRYAIMMVFRIFIGTLSLSRRFSFDLEDLDALHDASSVIIAPNHPSLLDAVMVISRLPNVACVLKAELMNNVFLGAGALLARYIRNEPVRDMIRSAIRDFDYGSHLLLFPEGTRTTSHPVNPLKGSIGLIALHAQTPVQTVLIETNSKYLSKGWSLFRMPPMPIHYRARLGRRFDPPQHARHFMVELDHYFAHELSGEPAFYPTGDLDAQIDSTTQLTPPSPS